MNAITRVTAILLAATATFAQVPAQKEAPSTSIVGYVRDSGCVHRFHEVIKPLPNGCVEACMRGGSPLVVLTKNEHVYHPISAEMPDVDVRPKLLPFVGKWGSGQLAMTANRGKLIDCGGQCSAKSHGGVHIHVVVIFRPFPWAVSMQ